MKKENDSIKITAIISGVVLIIALVALSSMNPTQNTVNVQGLATVKAMPDLIGVYFNIETKGKTTQEVKDSNSEILNKLITELEKQGFEREEIVTQNYNIYPDYEWNNGKRTDKGFVATHQIRVEIVTEESEKLGAVIDAGADAGAGISYINFELTQDSQNKYKAEAMKLAAEDAKIKAEAVAQGFDKKIGKLVSTSVNDYGYYPWNVYSSKSGVYEDDYAEAQEAASNIQPGEKDITASVSAVFKLN